MPIVSFLPELPKKGVGHDEDQDILVSLIQPVDFKSWNKLPVLWLSIVQNS